MSKTPAASKPAELDPHLTITVDEVEREFFMSFGLLDALTRTIGDPANIGAVHSEPNLREDVLKALLAERKKSGKVITASNDVDDYDISIADIEKLLDWAVEHVMSFFVRSLQKVVNVTERHKGQMEALASSLAGSNASASNAA